MEGKDKRDVTGGCHFVSWHLFLLWFLSGFCSKLHYLCALDAPPSAPLAQALWGHQDMQTNFSHRAGVPGKGVCPSEVHVNTAPPSLKVCYACPPCWLPPKLLPLILILPTAIACGDSAISQLHRVDAGSSDHYLQRLLPPVTLQKLLASLHSTCASCLPKESKFQVESVLRLGAQKGMWALSRARTHF